MYDIIVGVNLWLQFLHSNVPAFLSRIHAQTIPVPITNTAVALSNTLIHKSIWKSEEIIIKTSPATTFATPISTDIASIFLLFIFLSHPLNIHHSI